ncbi:glycoside hydrolase domain-containing protein [Kitasatospora sp. MBT63]|uniref:glycoside hydrolase domain-containing protein n=1 Tax=Kitasatospora sp. MBT63 TaxID=1444768 RepID=UPI0006918E68|nr:glycoside hydrolase domain-containing protein [Kitasatospora sp. MBT63]
MTILGVDYPWTHPAPAALKAAGAQFAMRYLSTDATKNLTRREADALAAAGIWSGVVWETTAGRALAGQAAGAADARAALAQAQACGMPSSRPIYFAVDTDTTWGAVLPYFRGVTSVLPPARVGVYGGIRVVAGAADSGLVQWYWQASAWSGGRWDPRAHIRQLGYITIGGIECDRNTAQLADYGQWMPGRTPEETDMPLTDTDIQRVAAAVVPAVVSALLQAQVPRVNGKWEQDPARPGVELQWLLAGIAPTQYQLADVQAQLTAQGAAVNTLAQLAAQQHPDINVDALVAEFKAELAKLDLRLTVTPSTPAPSAG